MVNWIGDSNMPMGIGSPIGGRVTPAYHIRFQNDRRGDPVHLQFNRNEAMILLRKFYNTFPQLR